MLQNSPLMIVETSMVMMRVRHRDGDFAFNQSVCLKNLCESIEVAVDEYQVVPIPYERAFGVSPVEPHVVTTIRSKKRRELAGEGSEGIFV